MMDKVDNLDDLFAAAAAQKATPSDMLIARILDDATAFQPKAAGVVAPRPAARGGFLSVLYDWFGGGMPVAGMMTAAVAGLYLGLAPPTALESLTLYVTGTTQLDSLDLLPSDSSLFAQE